MTSFSAGKRILKRGLDSLGLEVRRVRPASGSGLAGASNFGEEEIIHDLLGKLPVRHRYCVDIGAGDGEFNSNSFSLFRAGWEGLAAEWDSDRFAKMAYRYSKFAGARMSRTRVTPDNVLELLAAHEAPKDFGFLSLDIDSYDYFVLEKMLGSYRPTLICAEINEKIPPPLKFTVKWLPDHAWSFDHFYGQSLSMLEELGKRQGYVLVGLEYNNAFLVPEEANLFPILTAEVAYREGYACRPDRLQRLPWNRDMEPLLTMKPAEAQTFVRKLFSKYAGRYVLE
jgi:hypothetical protein